MDNLRHGSPAGTLTDRERDILRLLATGMSDSEIAESLVLTVGTVKWYNRQIYSKLNTRNRTEAVTQARQWGLLSGDSLAAMPVPDHNLPAQVTSFVGRFKELGDIKSLLRGTRLVTLTGPPGTGKTRLALAAAYELLGDFRDGVYFVPLAPVREEHHVLSTLVQTLNLKVTGSDGLPAVISSSLQDKEVLLVLDNFEHVLEVAPLVADLLAAAHRLRVLVTSREALHLYGEYEYSVPPLRLPDLRQPFSANGLLHYEAVDLFVQRARATSPGFALSDENATATAAICVHLDGLPLAIELAAARMKFYSPQTLLVRLGSRLEALGEGARDRPARQRTLRATLAWSYDLLTPEEQSLLARLGIFAGGFSTADAQAVCMNRLSIDVAEGLESLFNKSLLRQMQSAPGEPRFTMLETIREYALEKLDQRGERAAIEEQHARYYITQLAEAATPHEGKWLDWAETQHGNLRATLEWSLTHERSAQTSFELIATLARFWELRGYFSEGYAWLSKALSLTDIPISTKAHADAFFGIGLLILRQGDHATAQQLCSEALAIYQKLGDKRAVSACLVRLSEVTSGMGDYESAVALSHRGFSIACESGDPRAKANALSQIGFDSMRLGNDEEAQTVLSEALALFLASADRIGVALAQSGLGELAVRQGNSERASIALQSSLQLREEMGDRWGIAAVLGTLAWGELMQKNLVHAADLLKESILIRKEIGEQGGIAWCLEKLAEIAFINQDAPRAVRALGAAARIRRHAGSTIDPCDREHYDDMVARLRKQLGSAVWEAVWTEGQAMPLEHLMEYLSTSPISSTYGS